MINLSKLVKIVTHHEKPGKAAELMAKEGVIAIGWAKSQSIAGKSKDEIIQQLSNEGVSNPEWGASQLLTFRDEIQVGDIIIAYAPPNRVALIGEVRSGYIFNNKNEVGDPKGEISYPNQRKVEWWKSPRNFHRNLLPGDLKNLVASRGTIRILEYNLDVQRFSESLQKIAETAAGQELIAEVTGEDEIHEYLVNHLGELEEGLTFKESECGISVGSIDILAEDRNGLPVIIEVKVRADDSTIGQLLGYIQAYEEETGKKARGFIVAESFTERCKKAAKRAGIELYECRKMFKFRRMKQ